MLYRYEVRWSGHPTSVNAPDLAADLEEWSASAGVQV